MRARAVCEVLETETAPAVGARDLGTTIRAHSTAIDAALRHEIFCRLRASGLASELCPQMQDRMADQRPGTRALFARGVGGVLAAGIMLSACSSAGLNPLTPFADPGTYEFYTCDQIAAQRASWTAREQELKLLMDKAAQSTGGAVINVIAYQADYARARDELKVVEATARAKNCPPPKP